MQNFELLEKSYELAKNIRDPYVRGNLLKDIAEGYCELNEFKKALEIVNEIDEESIRLEALNSLAIKLAKDREACKELLKRSFKLAKKYGKMEEYIITLAKIANTLAEVHESYKNVISEALKNTSLLKIDEKAKVLSDILGIIKDLDESREVVKEVLKIVEKLDEKERDGVLSTVILDLLKIGNIEKAIELSKRIKDHFWKTEAYIYIAYYLYKSKKQYKNYINMAVESAMNIKDEFWRDTALTKIAICLVKTGDYDQAIEISKAIKSDKALKSVVCGMSKNEMFNNALELAKEIKSNFWKALALSCIVRDLGMLGKSYDEVLNKVLKIADMIDNPVHKSIVLYNISCKIAKIGDEKKALEIVEKIEDTFWKAKALRDIAIIGGKQ
ncbi:peptidase, caspase catalytic subunit [Methanocaldococcus villosus KIN24-T80]|uniref:Peptidase, caspase catalytic subunit n=1 Tax=Methanocaldococcus villosus KIN24-T80 TaxID=1069083 RepID=N6VSI2_9EURY|nr:hypothetical protein [Methanocaldococcus villosus]ENN96116.1 peptidase, caspase catalytic subunit [Methanocaldococcus villosus KIN24-T80]